MGSEKIYSDMLNDITESDLIFDNVDLEGNIKPQYVLLNSETSSTKYYVPIKIKIKDNIENTKIDISNIEHIKTKIIPITIKHIRRLKLIINLSEETEKFFSKEYFGIEEEYEILKTLYVWDGCSDERRMAISSYKKQLNQAEIKLKLFRTNYKTMKKNTLVNCRNSISTLLRDNGIRSHKKDAENLMNWNGVETPIYL